MSLHTGLFFIIILMIFWGKTEAAESSISPNPSIVAKAPPTAASTDILTGIDTNNLSPESANAAQPNPTEKLSPESIWSQLTEYCALRLESEGSQNYLAAEVVTLCAQIMAVEHRLIFLVDLPKTRKQQTFPLRNTSEKNNPFNINAEPGLISRTVALQTNLTADLDRIGTLTEQYCMGLETKKGIIGKESIEEVGGKNKALSKALPYIFEKAGQFCQQIKEIETKLQNKIQETNTASPEDRSIFKNIP